MSPANSTPFKLKRVRVNLSRSTYLIMSLTNIRDQIPLKRCTVRLERCNMPQLIHLGVDQNVCGTTGSMAVVPSNLYNGHKLKRLCVRVPRINYGARSNISSRSTSVINGDNDSLDFQGNA